MISLLISLAVFGFVLWLLSLVPMQPVVKQIIIGIAILGLVVYLLSVFGVLGPVRWHAFG